MHIAFTVHSIVSHGKSHILLMGVNKIFLGQTPRRRGAAGAKGLGIFQTIFLNLGANLFNLKPYKEQIQIYFCP